MTVREVRPDDRAEWLRMRAALWPEGAEAEHALEIDAFLREPRQGQKLPPGAVLVSPGPGGGLQGFLELSVRAYAEGCTGPVPYVEGWYVDAESRGRGVGRALVEAAERWAGAHGYTELASDTGLENQASQRAHRALGFEEVERVVLFRKPLSGTAAQETSS